MDPWFDEAARGRLSPARREAVERHLVRCPRCQALARAEEQARAALALLAPEQPPANLVEAVMARVAEVDRQRVGAGDPGVPAGTTAGEARRRLATSAEAEAAASRRPRGWRRPLAVVLGTAALGLAVAVGRLVGWPSPGSLNPAASQTFRVEGVPAAGGVAGPTGGVMGTAGREATLPVGEADGSATTGDPLRTEAMSTAPGQGPRLIRSARLALAVPEVEPVFAEAQALVRRIGGRTERAQLAGTEPARSATLLLRVPVDRLDEAMDRLAALAPTGRVEARDLTTQDISRAWVEGQAHLAALRAEERRLRERAQRSAGGDELHRVERELRRVREQIQRLEGQLRSWEQAVRLARIELTLHPLRP
ncbi:MAG TPA: DUF4349 domain-containing protein [Thermaerobacter sp.]